MNEPTPTEQGVTPAVLESLASDVQALREQLISSEGEAAKARKAAAFTGRLQFISS